MIAGLGSVRSLFNHVYAYLRSPRISEDVTAIEDYKKIFFANPELQHIPANVSTHEKFRIIAQNVLKFIIIGENRNEKAGWETLKLEEFKIAINSKKSPPLMHIFREEIRTMLVNVFHNVKDLRRDEAFTEKLELSIANILSDYVMFEPNPFDAVLAIPRLIDNRYQLIEYNLTPLEITDKATVEEADRVFAYGLTPVHNTANRIIIFCGTTFPTGQGSKTQNAMNWLYPNTMVGELYHWDNVHAWLNLSADHKGVDVYGGSQGGSLSLALALMRPEKLNTVHAFNPPGMANNYNEQHPKFGPWDIAVKKGDKLPQVIIQAQQYDPVSSVGYWKPQWQILKITLGDLKLAKFPVIRNYLGHLLSFAGQYNSKIIKMNGSEDNTHGRYIKTLIMLSGVRRILSLVIGKKTDNTAVKLPIQNAAMSAIHTQNYLIQSLPAPNLMESRSLTPTFDLSLDEKKSDDTPTVSSAYKKRTKNLH